MWLFTEIAKAWRKRLRSHDLNILWPEIKNMTNDLTQAREIFLVHTEMDPAWQKDMTFEERMEFVGNLT